MQTKSALRPLFAAAIGFLALHAATVRSARADSDLAYFQQFLYTEETDADDHVTTRYLMTTGELPGFDVVPGSIKASADLILLQGGKFILKYMEMTPTGAPISFPMATRFEGEWTVPADKMLVGDLAEGARAVYQGRNAVLLTFLKDLKAPGLQGKSVVMDLGFSNIKAGDHFPVK